MAEITMTEQQQRFVDLRSQGWTYVRIAEEVGVTKRTLITWSRKFQFEIQNQRALELEAIQARFIATREERIKSLGEQLHAVEAELKKRDISELSTHGLFTLAANLRREIQQAAGPTKFSIPTDGIPWQEFNDQVLAWSA
jgi:transcriptional regulator